MGNIYKICVRGWGEAVGVVVLSYVPGVGNVGYGTYGHGPQGVVMFLGPVELHCS